MVCCFSREEHAIDLWSSPEQGKILTAQGVCGGPRAARGIQSAANRTTRVVALAVRVCCDYAGGGGPSSLLLSVFLSLSSLRSFFPNSFRSGPPGGYVAASSPLQLDCG